MWQRLPSRLGSSVHHGVVLHPESCTRFPGQGNLVLFQLRWEGVWLRFRVCRLLPLFVWGSRGIDGRCVKLLGGPDQLLFCCVALLGAQMPLGR